MSTPILIAATSVLRQLQSSSRMPVGLLSILDRDSILELISADDPLDPAPLLGINPDLVSLDMKSGSERSITERFIAQMANRRLIVVLEVQSGDVEAELNHQRQRMNDLAREGQDDQVGLTEWIMVLLVPEELSQTDLDALNNLPESGVQRIKRVYVIEGRLRSDVENRFVEANHVWMDAVPDLLVRLLTTRKIGDGTLWTWRSIIFEPEVDWKPVHDVFEEWYESLLASDEGLKESDFEVKVKPLKVTVEHDGVNLGEFEDPFVRNRFKNSVTEELNKGSTGTARTLIQEVQKDRIHGIDGAEEAAGNMESLIWSDVHLSPWLVSNLTTTLKNRRSTERQNQRVADEGKMQHLLQGLAQAETLKASLLRKASIIDKARAHFIPWKLRLVIGFVVSLLIFYVTFVVLEPILTILNFPSWAYWPVCLFGLAGVFAAIYWSRHMELHAGSKGTETLKDETKNAQENTPLSLELKFLKHMHEQSQRQTVTAMLGSCIGLVSRLARSMKPATNGHIDDPNAEPTGNPTNLIMQRDRDVFKKGTVFAIGRIESGELESLARRVLNDVKEEYKALLMREWNRLSEECDKEYRGTYPSQFIHRHWTREFQKVWIKFYGQVFIKVLEEWRRRESTMPENIRQQLQTLQGQLATTRPFLSSRRVDPMGDGLDIKLFLAQDQQLINSVKTATRELTLKRFTFLGQRDLPVFGLYFEEVPLHVAARGLS